MAPRDATTDSSWKDLLRVRHKRLSGATLETAIELARDATKVLSLMPNTGRAEGLDHRLNGRLCERMVESLSTVAKSAQ